MRLTYPAVFYPDTEKPGAYAVAVPDLPGCVSGGNTLADAIFMATDYATSPTTRWGQLIYGVGCGAVTSVIRLFGGYPEGVTYAILLMNVLTPLLDRWTRPRVFGEVKNK